LIKHTLRIQNSYFNQQRNTLSIATNLPGDFFINLKYSGLTPEYAGTIL
jgi:hypothetical protein